MRSLLKAAVAASLMAMPGHDVSPPRNTDEQIVRELDLERKKMDGLLKQLEGINKDADKLQKKIDVLPKQPVAPGMRQDI